MNIQRKNKLSGLVFIACFGLSTSVFSGEITGIASASPTATPGFDGWNLDNVEVLITDLDYVPYNPTLDPNLALYYPVDGSYDVMVLGDSFESLIYDGDPATGTATVMGRLHGKDWPVGDPSGVKVLTDTLAGTGEVMPNGKSDSCIMTTSYDPDGVGLTLEDPTTAVYTTCNSPFQSHKRFKINLQPSLIDEVGEESVDMVFNVETETDPNGIHRYQVYQKINNYTDSRLSGYTLEVGFGVGAAFVPRGEFAALTLSIGIGENTEKLVDGLPTNIWDVEQMANFSHGLWGPALDPKYFLEDGFFSDTRTGYVVSLSADKRVISSGITLDEELGGNYETLLGEWLPSIWAPSGILWDDDNNSATDAVLMAFWADIDGNDPDGDGIGEGDGTYAWTGGFPDFEKIDPAVVNGWAANSIYELGKIEDVLNLGLNYNVEVGNITTFPTWDVNTATATFTIRITPIKAIANQVEPGWITNPPVFESTYNPAIPAIITYLLF